MSPAPCRAVATWEIWSKHGQYLDVVFSCDLHRQEFRDAAFIDAEPIDDSIPHRCCYVAKPEHE